MDDEKHVVTIVSSGEVGLQRRNDQVTTSSFEEIISRKKTRKKKRLEILSLSKERTARSYTLPKTNKTVQKTQKEVRQQASKAQ